MTSEKRNCQKKKTYASRKEAQSAVNYYRQSNGINLEPYRCRECRSHHLTKAINWRNAETQ